MYHTVYDMRLIIPLELVKILLGKKYSKYNRVDRMTYPIARAPELEIYNFFFFLYFFFILIFYFIFIDI